MPRTIPPPPMEEVQTLPELMEEVATIAHLGVDVLGYDKLSSLHLGWFQELLTNQRLLFLAPRSHFKTVCISTIFSTYRILKNRDIRILLVNEILENAKGFLREIKAHFQSRSFKDEFGDYVQGSNKWSETSISVATKRLTKDPTIAVAGTMGTIVSRHCDLIILDDPISNKNSQTPAQRKKISRWFAEALMPILEPDGQIIVTGTRWHHDDLYAQILSPRKYKNWKKIVLQAEWTDEDGYHILFPERFSKADLEQLKEDMTEPYYNSQYLNDPSKLEGQNFKLDWLDFYDDEPKNLKIYQGVDLAISKNDKAAFFALVTIGLSSKGDIYLLDYIRERLDFPEQCQATKSHFRMHNPLMCGIESNAYQAALPQWLRADPEARRFPFKGIPTSTEKIGKLTTLGPLFANKVIKINESMHEFIDEYLSFPQSGTFDLLDALFLAIEVSKAQNVEPEISEIDL